MTRSVVYGPSVTLDAGGNKWVNLADGVAASDAATVGQIAGGSVTYGTPAVVLGTAAAAGSIAESIRRDATIVAFDATSPTTQAFGDSAATGSAAVAARRDHKHAMPATPVTSIAKSGSSAITGAATLTGGTNVTLTQSGSDISIAASAAAAAIGSSSLIYRYTVAGSDKASIDTSVDTADAGSGVWTNGDLLEIYLYCRTAEAVVGSGVGITLNNDVTGVYDRTVVSVVNATVAGGSALAQTEWSFSMPGSSMTASYFGTVQIVIPNYMTGSGFKAGTATTERLDASATNAALVNASLIYKSTSAISRVKVAPTNASPQNLKVGTQLLIYKRLAS